MGEVHGKIPKIESEKNFVFVKPSGSFKTGSATTKTETKTVYVDKVVPANSMVSYTITGTEYKSDIPYRAILGRVGLAGDHSHDKIVGVYKIETVTNLEVSFGDIKKI